jgi:hypothetical protein
MLNNHVIWNKTSQAVTIKVMAQVNDTRTDIAEFVSIILAMLFPWFR